MSMEKIICGFAGIGKSYLAKELAGVVDLESTPFNKDWSLYADVAKHMVDNGYTVLMSCHKELRDTLTLKNISYTVAIPRKEDKDIYIDRYYRRGNTKDFIDMMLKNFENFIDEIEKNEKRIFYVDNYLELN